MLGDSFAQVFWVTIMFSQTLGTALGDRVSDTVEMGYLGAAGIFGGLLVLTVLAYYRARYPEGKNILVTLDQTEPETRVMDGMEIIVAGLADLSMLLR